MRTFTFVFGLAICSGALPFIVACDSDAAGEADDGSSGGSTGGEELEIVGDWIETFEGGMVVHSISEDTWSQDLGEFGVVVYLLEDYDNAEGWVVGQADAMQGGDGTYSRFDWTYDDQDVLHYCTSAFMLSSAEDAIAATPADAGDLETGCGGFAWSKLEPN